jgi:hypothetical protein
LSADGIERFEGAKMNTNYIIEKWAELSDVLYEIMYDIGVIDVQEIQDNKECNDQETQENIKHYYSNPNCRCSTCDWYKEHQQS